MKLKHYLFFFLSVCIMISALSWFLFFQETEEAKISLEFIEQDRFTVNEVIEPLSLIKATSTSNIVYPKIDTSTPGEKQLIYIAVDENGVQKEFLKTINIYSPKPPVMKLKRVALTINVGDSFDPLDNVEEASDAYDGKLQTKVSGTYNLKKAGNYILTYTVENSSGIKSQAELNLTAKEKPQKPVIQPPKNVPVTGTIKETPTPKPSIKHQTWRFKDGYDFNSAKDACMKTAETLNVRYTCDVVYVDDIAVGYQLIY